MAFNVPLTPARSTPKDPRFQKLAAVPAQSTDLRLRISWGGAWIDALDWIVAGRRDIALR